ncbi:MAG: hypothetical protein WCA32_24885 [Chromatiaceae bacterium]
MELTIRSETIQMAHVDPKTDHNLQQPAARTARALDDRLRSLARELCPGDAFAGARRPEDRLHELAGAIESETTEITMRDSARILQSLTQLYRSACRGREDEQFTATAASYAAVISALSRRFPGLDFDEAVGQLLKLMIRLFKSEDAGWVTVYRQLRSIPDSVSAKQQLQRVCSADIREWFDAGVKNLFSLRDGLFERIGKLDEDADAIAREIQAGESELAAARTQSTSDGRVIVLADRVKARQIAALREKRQSILDEKAGKADTVSLIQADIREFERRLGEARRAYLVRPA